MKEFKIKGKDALSIGVTLGTLVLGLLKLKVDSNAKAAEKAEIVEEIMQRLNSQNND